MVPGGQAGFPLLATAVLAAVTADDVTAASGAGEIRTPDREQQDELPGPGFMGAGMEEGARLVPRQSRAGRNGIPGPGAPKGGPVLPSGHAR
jgi:hypothetical protein